jgi:hypothetical protein
MSRRSCFLAVPHVRAVFGMLGIHIHIAVAVAWQRASAGDWTSYAADVSRRPTRH